MKIWKITMVVSALLAFKGVFMLDQLGRYSAGGLWIVGAVFVFVLGCFLKGFADDKLHQGDPNWPTMKDSIILLVLWKIFKR